MIFFPVFLAIHSIQSLQFYNISKSRSICELSLDVCLCRKHGLEIRRYRFHDVKLVRATRRRERDRIIACFLSFRFSVFFAGE